MIDPILSNPYYSFMNALAELLAVIDDQAEDIGLWSPAQTSTEAYLQEALRKLHEEIERLAESGVE